MHQNTEEILIKSYSGSRVSIYPPNSIISSSSERQSGTLKYNTLTQGSVTSGITEGTAVRTKKLARYDVTDIPSSTQSNGTPSNGTISNGAVSNGTLLNGTLSVENLNPLRSSSQNQLASENELKPLDIEGDAPMRPISRGLSRVWGNEHLVDKMRDAKNLANINEARNNQISGRQRNLSCYNDDSIEDNESENDDDELIRSADCTFSLPDIYSYRYTQEQKEFLHLDLIDIGTLNSLQESGHLNWWTDISACRRLMPMSTSGDGNCLLHAASLAMWGFHDRSLRLRRALARVMQDGSASFREGIKRRWRWSVTQSNREIGLMFSESEWEKEWTELINLASAKPRSETLRKNQSTRSHCLSPVTYESLEEVHVFVLAHILRRPIIVVAKTMLYNNYGEALSPIPFSGIYLPLEREPAQCHRVPLLLAYDCLHFSALVPMVLSEGSIRPDLHVPADAIPLVNSMLELLPIHYLVDPGRNDFDDNDVAINTPTGKKKLNILYQYIDIIVVAIPETQFGDGAVLQSARGVNRTENGQHKILCANLSRRKELESWREYVDNYLTAALKRFEGYSKSHKSSQEDLRRFSMAESSQSGNTTIRSNAAAGQHRTANRDMNKENKEMHENKLSSGVGQQNSLANGFNATTKVLSGAVGARLDQSVLSDRNSSNVSNSSESDFTTNKQTNGGAIQNAVTNGYINHKPSRKVIPITHGSSGNSVFDTRNLTMSRDENPSLASNKSSNIGNMETLQKSDQIRQKTSKAVFDRNSVVSLKSSVPGVSNLGNPSFKSTDQDVVGNRASCVVPRSSNQAVSSSMEDKVVIAPAPGQPGKFIVIRPASKSGDSGIHATKGAASRILRTQMKSAGSLGSLNSISTISSKNSSMISSRSSEYGGSEPPLPYPKKKSGVSRAKPVGSCLTRDCNYMGCAEQNNLCSFCYQTSVGSVRKSLSATRL